MKTTQQILIAAKEAELLMRSVDDRMINNALSFMADEIVLDTDKILAENALDVCAARGYISDVMIDRLTLTSERILQMADGIRQITKLPSPLGIVTKKVTRPNGLEIMRVSAPMGVIAIIYESRPNVTSDAAALAIKSGNVCILRGGKEAYRSARAIVDAMARGLVKAGLPSDAVQLIDDITRESANQLMRADGYVDLLIPRGGKGLIRACVENATVPCIETGTGICHIYVDAEADLDMAVEIVNNAKTSRPSVCNACEVCIVHKDIAPLFLPRLYQKLVTDRTACGKIPVEIRADGEALKYISAKEIGDNDYDTEFLDYILAIKTTDSLDEAIKHIGAHSTHHSEAIITKSKENADCFTKNVDSAAVYVNASTRFTDGGEFGLGCEMGISTQKMHARGPVGIEELTTYKYIINGSGQIR